MDKRPNKQKVLEHRKLETCVRWADHAPSYMQVVLLWYLDLHTLSIHAPPRPGYLSLVTEVDMMLS